MSEFDSKALASAREVMALTRQEHIGGDAQLIAKIQLLFVDAMKYAAPQSFGNSEQLNSPDIPDGWIKCSERLPPEGCEADGGAVFYLVWNRNEVDCGPQYSISNVFFLRKHWEKHFTHWQPLPAAPKQESE